MRNSIFGWDLPPGAANHPSAPWNQVEGPCDICGQMEDDCICAECLVCGSVGDVRCYLEHGMVRSLEQVEMRAEAEAQWKAAADAENAWEEMGYICDWMGIPLGDIDVRDDTCRECLMNIAVADPDPNKFEHLWPGIGRRLMYV